MKKTNKIRNDVIWLFLFLTIFSYFPFIRVNAVEEDGKLSYDNYELECVYDNGLSLVFSGEAISGDEETSPTYSYSVKIDSFPVANQIEVPFNSGYKFFYKESETAKRVLDTMKCPDFIQGGLYQQTTLTGSDIESWEDLEDLTDTSVQVEIYSDREDAKEFTVSGPIAYENFLNKKLVPTLNPACFADDYKEHNFWADFYDLYLENGIIGEDGCFKFWGKFLGNLVEEGSILSKRALLHGKDAPENEFKTFWFKLLSERVYFNDYVKPVEEIGFKAEGIQAASTPEYLMVIKYKTPANNTVLLASKDSTITPLTATSLTEYSLENATGKTASFDFVEGENTRYLCFSESVKSLEKNKNMSAYKFSKTRHVVAGTSSQGFMLLAPKNGSGSSSYKDLIDKTGIDYVNRKCNTEGYTFYEEAELTFEPDIKVGTSICEVIPKTAVWIALIINYAQIIIPILLIGLTAFDLSRIILNDNVEEELPKKKKIIFVRLCVAVAFFFIPLFIKLVINDSYGTDFGDVSCLFQDYNDVGSVSDAEAQTNE